MVGALAQAIYPGGILIQELDELKALEATRNELQKEHVVLFEPAFAQDNMLVRADILVKTGTIVELIEVKAKSIDSKLEHPLRGKSGKIKSEWKPYIADIAFQTHVVQQCLPHTTVKPFLMGVDKHAVLSNDKKDDINQPHAKKDSTEPDATASTILAKIPVRGDLEQLMSRDFNGVSGFMALIEELDAICQGSSEFRPSFGWWCQSTDFRNDNDFASSAVHLFFSECFSLPPDLLSKPNIFDLGKNALQNSIDISDEKEFFLESTSMRSSGVLDSNVPFDGGSRQFAQIEIAKREDLDFVFKKEVFQDVTQQLRYPLHFIDFETCTPPIPWFDGCRPYGTIAFQYSHHQMNADGTVAHQSEFTNLECGVFPNYEFVRQLKSDLENDVGSILRYAEHENTVLNHIYVQLRNSDEADRDELMAFIRSITKSSSATHEQWDRGERCMVDLCKIVSDCFIHPRMKSSVSIKPTLPAAMEISDFISHEYGGTKYGTSIPSLNFPDGKQWYDLDDAGDVVNPYELLPPLTLSSGLFNGTDLADLESIKNGAAALMAYSLCQSEACDDSQLQAIGKGLRQYCELDTLAMVMIFQAFTHLCSE